MGRQKLIISIIMAFSFAASAPVAAQFTPQYELIKAAEKNDLEKMKQYLTTKNVSPNVRSRVEGYPVLLSAIDNRAYDAAEMLLKFGGDVNITDERKRETALMRAAESGNMRLMAILMPYKPDLDLRDAQGQTALMKAVRGRKMSAVKILLKEKADINGTDMLGNTAHDYARQNRDRRTLKLLEAAGAN